MLCFCVCRGANPYDTDTEGETALHFAIRAGRTENVKILLNLITGSELSIFMCVCVCACVCVCVCVLLIIKSVLMGSRLLPTSSSVVAGNSYYWKTTQWQQQQSTKQVKNRLYYELQHTTFLFDLFCSVFGACITWCSDWMTHI